MATPLTSQKYQITYDSLHIGFVKSFTLSIESGQIQVDGFDVAGISRYIKGRSDVSISVTALYTRGQDAGHLALLTDSIAEAGAKPFEISPKDPLDGDNIFTGKARPSNVEISAEDDEAVELSFDLQVSREFEITTPANDFVIQIDTTLGDGLPRMRLPIQGSDMRIDWGDGTVETVTQTFVPSSTNWVTHEYATGGLYEIRVSKEIGWIRFNNQSDYEKVVLGKQWGAAVWSTMLQSFRGCLNLIGQFSDIPNLSNVTSTNNMFNFCQSFNDPSLTQWNVSNVTDMASMFNFASVFNQDLSGWCVEQIPEEPSLFANQTPAWTLPKPNWGAPCS